MSTRAKGGRNRRKVQRYFESLGYIVANVEKGGSRYLKERDLFALSQGENYSDKGFDLLALGKGNIILIQVKSNKPATAKFYKDFAKQYEDGYLEVLCVTAEDYYGLRLQWYQNDGSVIEQYITKDKIPS